MATIDTGAIRAVESSSVGQAHPVFVTDTGAITALEASTVAGSPSLPTSDIGPVAAVETSGSQTGAGVLNLPQSTPLAPWPLISDLVQVNTLADPRAAADPNVYSISYRTAWSLTQPVGPASGQPTNDPNDPSFSWAFVDSCFAQAEAHGKKVWLRFLVQQGSCPGWCRQNVQAYYDTTGQRWNIWWDPVYNSYLIAFAQAVAKRYGSHPSLAVFSANMHAGGTGDWSMPQVAASPKATGAGNWTLAASWVCPAYGQTVTVYPAINQTIYKGWVVWVPNFGWFFVNSVNGPNTNPTSVVLQNLGYSGNASSGTVSANAIMQVSDVQQLTSPYFNYTTQKVVNAMVQVANAYLAAFPNSVVISQEVGRCGSIDPWPQQGISWAYNCATQLAQIMYATAQAGRWRISKDTLQTQFPLPHLVLALEDGSQAYLPAQPPFGSVNASGTSGVIPQGAVSNMQWNWNCVDPTGQYTPDSTASANSPYAANGGVPYNQPLPVFQNGMTVARYYGASIVECYEIDVIELLDLTVPLQALIVPPYAGQNQTSLIAMAYPPPGMECGPEVMPPNPYTPETDEDWLPPPVKQIDIFTAQQTFPL